MHEAETRSLKPPLYTTGTVKTLIWLAR